MKWCWSRLAGGVVTWEAYELFRVGEQGMASNRTGLAALIRAQIPTWRAMPLLPSSHSVWNPMREPRSFSTSLTSWLRSPPMERQTAWVDGNYRDLQGGGHSISLMPRLASMGVTDPGRGSSISYLNSARVLTNFKALPMPQVICSSPTYAPFHQILSEVSTAYRLCHYHYRRWCKRRGILRTIKTFTLHQRS